MFPRTLALVLLAGLLSGCGPGETGEVHVVPVPRSVQVEAGFLTLDAGTRLVAVGEAVAPAERLADVLRPSTGYELPVVDDDPKRHDVVWSTATHTHTPVLVVAFGPDGSTEAFAGIHDQSEIGRAMQESLLLE